LRRLAKWAVRGVALVLVLLVLALLGAWLTLRASLPRLDGEIAAGGPAVTIERDALGIATVRGATREAVSYGLGFAHAQDRFFQMDLSRRLAAGELVTLFGEVAAEQDARAGAFGFRAVAREVLRRASAEERANLAAYAQGVNAGLASLSSRPWEYWLLRRAPAQWLSEDTILVVYAMWWDLQYEDWKREIVLRTLDERLGGPRCDSGWKCATEFFYPARSEWDAPNGDDATTTFAPATLPSGEVVDLRNAPGPAAALVPPERAPIVGSNNWVVAGAHTSNGAALVANDMHLNLRVPNVWYRARLIVAGEPPLELNGVTLPGAPLLVAGSNGHIAWGFTNSYGDWQDVSRHACDANGAGVRVADANGGQCWFVRWLAQSPEATNVRVLRLERARSVDEALGLAATIGIPHQNFVVGDRAGHIGWTLIGRIPAGTGADRMSGAGGWLDPASYPRIVDPDIGRIWSANSLTTADAEQLRALADDEAATGAGYDLGARGRQIRDDLLAVVGKAAPADMLQVQLDDRALHAAHWRDFLLRLLDAQATKDDAARAEFRRLIADWLPRAAPESVGYRLVRAAQARIERSTWRTLLAGLGIELEEAPVPARFEVPLWRLVTEQPPHLLAPPHTSWRGYLLAEVDAAIAELVEECGALETCAWGERRPVRVRHPLSRAVPALSGFLDMPTMELAGDGDMPRVQSGSFGASQRFAVSPGHEAEGYLHIAGGQSGHPLSRFYRAGFAEWAGGKPLPFLPGNTEHRLRLR
jgi:penicillin G amidase